MIVSQLTPPHLHISQLLEASLLEVVHRFQGLRLEACGGAWLRLKATARLASHNDLLVCSCSFYHECSRRSAHAAQLGLIMTHAGLS
jgi:hypothetical protein